MVAQAQIAHRLENELVAPAAGASDHQQIRAIRPPVQADPQGLEQGRQVLARLQRADEQHKRAGHHRDAVEHARLAGAQLQPAIQRRRRLVDHGDLLDRDVEELGDILARRLGDSDDAIGARGVMRDLAIIGARRVVQDLGVVQKGQVVDRDHGWARAAHRRDKIGAMQHIRAHKQQLERQRPLLEPVMRRGQDRSPHDVWRDGQRAQLIAMLKARYPVVACHLGQRCEQLARILWDPALPIGVQAGVDRDMHAILTALQRWAA